MPGDPLLYRLPVWIVIALLALTLVLALFASSMVGRRAHARGRLADLGALETMASGLLGLLLAFNFSIAQGRFEARQQLLVREADAIGTTFLRCSVLESLDDRVVCRSALHRYAELRIYAYEKYGLSEHGAALGAEISEGERLQDELWTLVARSTRAHRDPAHTLLMSALNDVIDLDADRRASIRITVPQAVSMAIAFVCVAWAVLLGYASGVQKRRSPRAGWIVVALLISVVFGLALDFDRPRSGFITTAAAERSMTNLLRSMQTPPLD